MSKKYFEPVDTKVNFSKLEERRLVGWYKNGVVGRYLAKNRSSKKYFSFMDGPITANGPMGVHHAWGRTYKDLWQRYKNMRGYNQRFQNGFDAQGLWVEVQVEKDLGFKSKKDIEDYGVAKFVQRCKDRVKKFSAIQTEQSKRLGYFMDWDNSYYTMSDENNYMIWHFLKECHKNGWLYKGQESVPWCPRCQTAISQHEMLTEDYKEVTHKAIYIEFPILGRDREYLLVWTTTPWTIPANIAVAVDEKMDYSLVEGEAGDLYWVAKAAVKRVFGSTEGILKTVKGSELVGLVYKAPFDNLPAVGEISKENPKTFHRVIATDERIMPISTEEGTGLVHTAVSAGTEDYKLGKKYGLPMIPIIADDASYLDNLGFLTGLNAKDKPEIILDYLTSEDKKAGVDWVFKIHKYKHRYPVCWRCKTELVWKVTDEWYIAMDKGSPTLRSRMKKVTRNIGWIPEFGLKRELDWLTNMNDWLISKKNRYWGLALPIWECDECGCVEVVGSREELKEKAVEGWKDFEGKSPHKPQIDKIKLNCPECKSRMTRIEPVGNPWLDAGIVPYSTIAKNNKGAPLYLSDKKEWRKWFPADFITESFPGQFKNWFYSMIAMSSVLENTNPYKTVLGFATLLGSDGRAMHKSWGNSIDFNEGAEKIGVDVMRWMFARQEVASNLIFGIQKADEVRRQFHLMLWNTYNYFVTYANLDGWKPRSVASDNVLDKWILARLGQVQTKVANYLDDYNAQKATSVLEEFVEDLSRWYVRRSRDRVGVLAPKEEKDAFFATLYKVLTNLSCILAPFIPFISDEIYTNLVKADSVHLADWPDDCKLGLSDNVLIENMRLVREVVEKGHSERKRLNLPVRQPLLLVKVYNPNKRLPLSLLSLIKDELNVKEIFWKVSDKFTVKLDTKLTPALVEEAKTRELIRKVQVERRSKEFGLTDKIKLTNSWFPRKKKMLELLRQKTLATSFNKGDFDVSKS